MIETGGGTRLQKLDVRTVSKIFTRNNRVVRALDPVSLTIPEGRLISLIGPSGCGKSTLFNIIAGLLRPTTGDVLADGTSIIGRPGFVAYMLQKGLLLPVANDYRERHSRGGSPRNSEAETRSRARSR